MKSLIIVQNMKVTLNIWLYILIIIAYINTYILDQVMDLYLCNDNYVKPIEQRNCPIISPLLPEERVEVHVKFSWEEGTGGVMEVPISLCSHGVNKKTCINPSVASKYYEDEITVLPPANCVKTMVARGSFPQAECCWGFSECTKTVESIWSEITKSTAAYNIEAKQVTFGDTVCITSPCEADRKLMTWSHPVITVKKYEDVCVLDTDHLLCPTTKQSFRIFQRGSNVGDCYTESGMLCTHNMTLTSIDKQEVLLSPYWSSKQYGVDYLLRYVDLLDEEISRKGCLLDNINIELTQSAPDLLANRVGWYMNKEGLYYGQCTTLSESQVEYDGNSFFTTLEGERMEVNPLTRELSLEKWPASNFINISPSKRMYCDEKQGSIIQTQYQLRQIDHILKSKPDDYKVSVKEMKEWIEKKKIKDTEDQLAVTKTLKELTQNSSGVTWGKVILCSLVVSLTVAGLFLCCLSILSKIRTTEVGNTVTKTESKQPLLYGF